MAERDSGDILPESLLRLGAGQAGKRFLAPHHLEAGRWLVRLFARARIMQRVTMSYDPARIGSRRNPSGQGEIADSAAEARHRLGQLAGQLPPDCWGVLTDLCGLDKGLQQIEQERGWPRRSAKLVLRVGLDQLAGVLRLSECAEGRPRGTMESWLPERVPMFPER